MILVTPNGHAVTKIDDKLFLVDTGSPHSFSFCELRRIKLGNGSFSVPDGDPSIKVMADQLTGLEISGFIGTDILFETGLTLDYEDMQILFSVPRDLKGCSGFCFIPIEIFRGQLVVTDKIILEGQKLLNTVIDTGAWLSYVSSQYLGKLKQTEESYEDDSPLCGHISGNYYVGSLCIDSIISNKFNYPVKVGRMPSRLEATGFFDAIIGPELLSKKQVIFDFENKRLGIKYDGRKS